MKRLTQSERDEKVAWFVKLVKSHASDWSNPQSSVRLKGFIETTIGTAFWYLNMESWSGFISKALLREYHQPTGKIRAVEDHICPRKQTGIMLLQFDWSSCENPVKTMKDFIWKYGTVNYVTQTENALLRKFQKKDWQNAYANAGIELIQLDPPTDWDRISKGDKQTIEKYL